MGSTTWTGLKISCGLARRIVPRVGGDLSLQIETMLEVKPDASLKVCIHHAILPHHALIKPQIPKLGSYDDARFFPHIRTEVTYAIISIYDWTSGGEKDQYRTGCEGSGVKITSISFSNDEWWRRLRSTFFQ